MKIKEKLLKELSKKYAPSSMVPFKFGRYDAAVKTDDEGNALVLFIGTATETGLIRGNRFTRFLLKDSNGNVLKDHWDHKGKVG